MRTLDRLAGKPYDLFQEAVRVGWVQKRDYDILHLLYRFRFVTFSDIVRLYFPTKYGMSAAQKRMAKLYQWHMVDRFRKWSPIGETEYIYCLDSAGIFHLSGYLGQDVEDMGWRKRDIRISSVPHCVAGMRLYINLRRQVAIKRFEVEAVLEKEGLYCLRPDVYALFSKNRVDYSVFFEVDMGSEWLPKIHGKVKSYEAFYKVHREQPGFKMPNIVFVAGNEIRTQKLRTWVEKCKKVSAIQYRYWTFDRVALDDLRQ